MGASHNSLEDTLAEPWDHKERDIEREEVWAPGNRGRPVDARIGKKSHNDKQGSTCKEYTVLYLQVAGAQVHLATVGHRQEWMADNTPQRHQS